MKLLVLCVETNEEADTDPKYIDKTIRQFYVVNNDVSIKYIRMNGKGNYNKRSIIKQINEKLSGDFDETCVAYCIDIDNLADSDVLEVNKNIREYCDKRNYKYIWFCRDIEEVYLHKRIAKSEKKRESIKFSHLSDLGKATEASLSSNSETPFKSNLLCVLDSFLVRKPIKS